MEVEYTKGETFIALLQLVNDNRLFFEADQLKVELKKAEITQDIEKFISDLGVEEEHDKTVTILLAMMIYSLTTDIVSRNQRLYSIFKKLYK